MKIFSLQDHIRNTYSMYNALSLPRVSPYSIILSEMKLP